MRGQNVRERLEGDLLSALAKTYLGQPLRVARVLTRSPLARGHFSDAVVRDAFNRLRARILATDPSEELNAALQILAAGPMVDRNLEPLVEELCSMGPGIISNANECEE